jgi:molybdopterin-synthase adenylyltransferase
MLAPLVTASMLAQFVSLAVAPGGLGASDPLRFSLSSHTLEHMPTETLAGCAYEQTTCWGDRRPDLTSRHQAAEKARQLRAGGARTMRVRAGRASQRVIEVALGAIERLWGLS